MLLHPSIPASFTNEKTLSGPQTIRVSQYTGIPFPFPFHIPPTFEMQHPIPSPTQWPALTPHARKQVSTATLGVDAAG